MVKFKDTDFLHASSRVKSLERSLLTSRQLSQMVEAHTMEEALKIASDAGINVGAGGDYEEALKANLLETYRLLADLSGSTDVFNIFRYEYDGLNLKSLIKAQAVGREPSYLLTALGTVPPQQLVDRFQQRSLEGLPKPLAQAALEALDLLARTSDPQMVDILLDRAVLASMHEKAMEFDNRFIRGWVAAKIDISNIRCMVRAHRIGGGNDFIKKILAPGGTISEGSCQEAYQKGMDAIIAFIESSAYGQALEPAMASLRAGGSLTLFEKLCDNHMIRLLDAARLVPFGIEPLVVYLMAKENEIKAARIVLASRTARVDPDQIKERLRESYA